VGRQAGGRAGRHLDLDAGQAGAGRGGDRGPANSRHTGQLELPAPAGGALSTL
jgi:hypothetical protein